MGDHQAIAAVTGMLYTLLDAAVSEVGSAATVWMKPPSNLEANPPTDPGVNLFLYQVKANVASRNRISPEIGSRPGLVLDLRYLLTAYGDDTINNELVQLQTHTVLGAAMRAIHDHPVLTRELIESHLSAHADLDLWDQVERIRITPVSLSFEELSSLWTSFQSPYRISTVYEASVVLIEAQAGQQSALPVATLGPGNRGVITRTGAFPTLLSVRPSSGQVSARLGEGLSIVGRRLTGSKVEARVDHPLWSTPVTLPLTSHMPPSRAGVILPDPRPSALSWPAGHYTLCLLLTDGTTGRVEVTNALPFSLAPQISASGADVPRFEGESETPADPRVVVPCLPAVWRQQRVQVLLDDAILPARALATGVEQSSEPEFPAASLEPGTYRVRLRVDGVDSVAVDLAASPPALSTPDLEVP